MDKMVGKDFERSLILLKEVSEKEVAAVRKYSVLEIDLPAQSYAVIQMDVSFDQMQNFFTESYATIMKEMDKSGIKMLGAPCALYYKWDEQNNTANVAAAIPINRTANLGDIQIINLPAATACVVDYYGPYHESGPAHIACDIYLSEKGLEQKLLVTEQYFTDPSKEPDSLNWHTKIIYYGYSQCH